MDFNSLVRSLLSDAKMRRNKPLRWCASQVADIAPWPMTCPTRWSNGTALGTMGTTI